MSVLLQSFCVLRCDTANHQILLPMSSQPDVQASLHFAAGVVGGSDLAKAKEQVRLTTFAATLICDTVEGQKGKRNSGHKIL